MKLALVTLGVFFYAKKGKEPISKVPDSGEFYLPPTVIWKNLELPPKNVTRIVPRYKQIDECMLVAAGIAKINEIKALSTIANVTSSALLTDAGLG